jgi:hypothetical protein
MSTEPDVDARIRARLEVVVERCQPTRTGADVLPDLRSRAGRRAARRRVGRLVLGVAAMSAVVVAGIAVWPGDADKADVRTQNPAVGPATITPSHPTGEPDENALPGSVVTGDLPAPPLDVRWKHSTVWTGRELVVWGGELDRANMGIPGQNAIYNDGAAYDPIARHWRTMRESPLPGDASPGGGIGGGGVATAVWTGSEVLVVQAGRAAAWNPETDRWREVASPPGDGTLGLVAAGDVVIQLDRGAGWAWHPRDNEWSRLPDPPVELSQGIVVWTGEQVVVLGSASASGVSAGRSPTVGAAYDPNTEEWRELPSTSHTRAAAAVWTGEEVLVVDFDNTRTAAAYDPAQDEWHELPDLPLPLREGIPSAHLIGDTPVVWSREGAVMLVDGGWQPLPNAGNLNSPVAGGGVLWSVSLDTATSPPVMSLTAARLPAEREGE